METIKISEIKVIENPRKDFSSVDALAESIASVGLLQPIAVRPDGDVWVLVDGERRLRAFKKLKREEIPAYCLKELSAHESKEAQMVANLERADLTLIERMRGFSALLVNAPAKYNAKVIANKFGMKEKDVQRIVALAAKIDPVVDLMLSSGTFDLESIEVLSKIPARYQLLVVESAANDGNIERAIQAKAYELCFDDVFKEKQAEASGKIHYKDTSYYQPQCYTFDKEYAAEVEKAYEARRNKKEQAQAQKQSEERTAEQIEKNKKQKQENKANVLKILAEMKAELPKFLSKKPTEKLIKVMREEYVRSLAADDCRALLRAWGIEFKSDADTIKIKKLVIDHVIAPLVKTEAQAVKLFEWVNMMHGFTTVNDATGFKEWLRQMKA